MMLETGIELGLMLHCSGRLRIADKRVPSDSVRRSEKSSVPTAVDSPQPAQVSRPIVVMAGLIIAQRDSSRTIGSFVGYESSSAAISYILVGCGVMEMMITRFGPTS